MIPILFEPAATDFTRNGIGRLSDAISCVVHEARNGEFELEMEYPVDGAHYADIVHSAIIVAKPSARRSNQAFRIYQITKAMKGRVKILAQHISYQLSFIPVAPFTAENLDNALAYLKSMAAETCPFTFMADFTSDADFAIPLPSSIRSYLGGRRGSLLDIYGGEWEFDNYSVKLHRNRGSDTGYTIRYGKNLVSLEQEESILNTYTGIYPYWGSEGTVVTLPEKVIHASTAANFPYQRTLPLDFSDKLDAIPTADQLRVVANSFIEANDIGIPAVNLKIDFVNLPDTEEYKELLIGSENLDLCDTVTVIFAKLGITEKSQVVEIWWDVLKNRYQKIEVGNKRSTLATTIEQQMEMVEAAVTPDQMNQTIDRATGVLNQGTGGHIVLNRNPGGWANELLAMNTDNTATATRVLRINQNGIGFADSFAGPYHQAWLMDGSLSLGGVNNQQGKLYILDQNGAVIGSWDNTGIYANGGELKIGDKFHVDKDGNLFATDGTFVGKIESGTTITGASIYSSEIMSKNKAFYVQENGDRVEVGFSGFDVWDNRLRTNWVGEFTNPATGGTDAGINGGNGDAGFHRLFLMDKWFKGEDGSMWDVTRTLIWLANRVTSLENFCAHHDWSEGDDPDPGSGEYDNGDDMEGEGSVSGSDVNYGGN